MAYILLQPLSPFYRGSIGWSGSPRKTSVGNRQNKGPRAFVFFSVLLIFSSIIMIARISGLRTFAEMVFRYNDEADFDRAKLVHCRNIYLRFVTDFPALNLNLIQILQPRFHVTGALSHRCEQIPNFIDT